VTNNRFHPQLAHLLPVFHYHIIEPACRQAGYHIITSTFTIVRHCYNILFYDTPPYNI